jgi:hypothetical protein
MIWLNLFGHGMVRGLDSGDEPPAANQLPMVTNSLNSNSSNGKSLQLSAL